MQRVEHWLDIEQHEQEISFTESLVERFERLRFVSQRAIDRGHHRRRNVLCALTAGLILQPGPPYVRRGFGPGCPRGKGDHVVVPLVLLLCAVVNRKAAK